MSETREPRIGRRGHWGVPDALATAPEHVGQAGRASNRERLDTYETNIVHLEDIRREMQSFGYALEIRGQVLAVPGL